MNAFQADEELQKRREEQRRVARELHAAVEDVEDAGQKSLARKGFLSGSSRLFSISDPNFCNAPNSTFSKFCIILHNFSENFKSSYLCRSLLNLAKVGCFWPRLSHTSCQNCGKVQIIAGGRWISHSVPEEKF